MKNKLIIVLCIVALFIPTYIAVGFYMIAQSQPVSEKAITKMVMTDLNGTTFNFTKDKSTDTVLIDGNDPISFFVEMNKNSSSINSLPDPLIGGDCYKVTYYSYNFEPSYKYYFSDNADDAYYTNDKGEAFKIDREYASAFIKKERETL